MNSHSDMRLMLRSSVSLLRMTKVATFSSDGDCGAIYVGPRVCWAAGLAEFERVDISNLTKGIRFVAHLRLGNEGELRVGLPDTTRAAVGDLIKISAYRWQPIDAVALHVATLAKVDGNNRVIEFRQVTPRTLEVDPTSFPPLPALEVVVGLAANSSVEAQD